MKMTTGRFDIRFNPENLSVLLCFLLRQPKLWRPSQVFTDENGTPAFHLGNQDLRRSTELIIGLAPGVLLKGASGATYDLSLSETELCLTAFCTGVATALEVENFCCALSQECRVYYGFACLEDELHRRNIVTGVFGENKVESWVGLDSAKKLPGLYWLNMISEESVSRAQIGALDFRGLPDSRIDTVDTGSGLLHVVKLYANPEDWSMYDAAVSDVLDNASICFALKSREIRAKNFFDYQEKLAEFGA